MTYNNVRTMLGLAGGQVEWKVFQNDGGFH